MKKYIILAAFVAAGVISISQTQDVMTVKMKDGTVHEFKVEEVSEVVFQTTDEHGSPDVYLSCPDDNHPHLIDLGLPSGTKWACCNIGASSPEQYGGYYAWGETEEKNRYAWSTYIHCDGSSSTCHHIGDDIAGTEYDVAHVKWGGSWRMPSVDQIRELLDNCTRTWTQQNGVNGTLVTGPNGKTVFLPAAGYRWDDDLFGGGEGGHYWSSSLTPSYEYGASSLRFDSYYWYWYYYYRFNGFSVRAVCP